MATHAQDVFDVSGAGDTVVAVLSAALAAGLPTAEAMRLANHAAGIAVSKIGTVTVSREELRASLAIEQSSPARPGSLVDLEGARSLRALWATERLTVGFTNGCFDLLHPGHVALIAQAADACDRLIVAINSDASVRRLKGPQRPIQDEKARAEVIGAMRGVAAVMIFDEETPLRPIEALLPDVLIKGADYALDQVVGAETVTAAGGRVILAKLRPGHSTSALVAARHQSASK
jgi:D-beta-D-heptose 7-phosphate kinase/D-beta-D-heptose 1-phosphate adenosyltransferase